MTGGMLSCASAQLVPEIRNPKGSSGATYEQQALLAPDILAEEQFVRWIGLKGNVDVRGFRDAMNDLRRGVVRSCLESIIISG